MNKVKVRCSVCGKSFKTPSLKKTVCPDCDAAAKRARHVQTPSVAATPQPVATPAVDVRAALRAAQENQGQFGAYKPAPPPPPPAPQETATPPVPARAQAVAAGGARQPRPVARPERKPHTLRPEDRPKQARPPKERKPRLQIKPFEPTSEQVMAIRERYLQLAHPEFDGIRHQIATEMGVPLRAVKDVIKQIRNEQAIPSWWEQSGKLPDDEQIQKIRELYLPLLPEPEVGVHKRIAAELHLTNTSVYQAIGHIRMELNLPRYAPRETETETEVGVTEAGEEKDSLSVPLAAPIEVHAAAE